MSEYPRLKQANGDDNRNRPLTLDEIIREADRAPQPMMDSAYYRKRDVAAFEQCDEEFFASWLREGVGAYTESIVRKAPAPDLSGFQPFDLLFRALPPEVALPEIYRVMGSVARGRFGRAIRQVLLGFGGLDDRETRLVTPWLFDLAGEISAPEVLDAVSTRVCVEGGWHRDRDIFLAAFIVLQRYATDLRAAKTMKRLIGPPEARRSVFDRKLAVPALRVMVRSEPSEASLAGHLEFLQPELSTLPPEQCDAIWDFVVDAASYDVAECVSRSVNQSIRRFFRPRENSPDFVGHESSTNPRILDDPDDCEGSLDAATAFAVTSLLKVLDSQMSAKIDEVIKINSALENAIGRVKQPTSPDAAVSAQNQALADSFKRSMVNTTIDEPHAGRLLMLLRNAPTAAWLLQDTLVPMLWGISASIITRIRDYQTDVLPAIDPLSRYRPTGIDEGSAT